MSNTGKYIYGIINSPEALSWASGIYSIPYRDMAAIVSDSEIVDYNKVFKETLARQLVHHQHVIEEMPQEYTVIPMRLGTFVLDDSEALDVMDKGYSAMKHIFEKIENRLEIDVVAMWRDFNSILRQAGEDAEIKELKEKLLSNPKGITMEDQMKVGFMLKKTVNNWRKDYADKILKTLSEVSDNHRMHECMDDTMVLNSAFLLSKNMQPAFETKINELNGSFAEKLNFRCVGPLPLYNFYTLEVVKICRDRIEWAKEKLGLERITGKDDIKKAYQKAAFMSHPDRHPDKPGTEKEFNDITQAYKILLDCRNAFEQGGYETDSFPDMLGCVKDMLFVTVKE